jgi:hypothetical protein
LKRDLITNSDSSSRTVKHSQIDASVSVGSSQFDEEGYEYNVIVEVLNSK